ncbi:ABC transporter ATP-binding protein [Xenorhabdus hominickii]|uniref:Ferrichrysobactin transporter, permease ATPase n=1 Tax=Xenorhabdus hominickii TaxID=351679 RepID=A0A2G0QA89_XENHO|nr:ABC transporter ATP-binding protein [Xenorhabdus hominickii]AOM40898.1 iron-enterobactin transporter ATP-binding protein [Xenorhabdus hominickii]PHM56132.1 ferrichrysobactin transporter, permease ATPase [Xenorhabdus hominickii]
MPSDADTPMVTSRLKAHNLSLAYGKRIIIDGVNLAIHDGELTVIIGPNGCGKSTLLRAISRSMQPKGGEVLLDETNIHRYKPKVVARELSLLTQGAAVTEALTIYDLVSRGRYPYQSFLRQWSEEDENVVNDALKAVDLWDLSQKLVSELSGGQRQRAWFAMTLAQQTPIILLDEPTTYLDISHQIEVLDLCQQLHRQGKTLVLVLHDINLALRYASRLIMMKNGQVYSEGIPEEIVTVQNIADVFGLACRIIRDPESNKPLIIPKYKTNE